MSHPIPSHPIPFHVHPMSGTDQRMRLWDATTGKQIILNYGNIATQQRINRFVLTDDGEYVIVPNGTAVSTGRMQCARACWAVIQESDAR